MQAQAARQGWGGQRMSQGGGKPNRAGLGRAIRYLGRHPRSTALAYGSLLLATIAQLAVPQLVQNMIDAVQTGAEYLIYQGTAVADQPGYLKSIGKTVEQVMAAHGVAEQLLINAALIIVAFSIVKAVFSFLQTFMAETTSQGLAFDFRNQIFAKIQRLSFSYHDQNQTGQLMIRATDDVEKVRLFISQGLMFAAQALILLVSALIILATTNWALTLVILPILPIALAIFMVFGAVSQPLFGQLQMRLSKVNTVLQETVAGIKVVKAFAREKHQQERFDGAVGSFIEQQLKLGMVFAFLFPLIFLIAQAGQAALLYFGGGQIIAGTLTLGAYQKFSLYLFLVFFPLGQLGFIVALMSQASASAQRIFEILDARSDVTDKPDATDLPIIQGGVEFKDVTFRYFQSGEPVLDSVSFTAKSGQTIALLGGTGSGKTTIINLIPRFYDASDGQVTIDGHDVRDIKLDSLRSQIGIVLQETNLFSGTIRDNIAFGRSDATLDQVIDAAKAAAAHDFIMEFPQGYDTPVGERGTTLSGGQKQRIAIARALLLDPRLLILDDSTSSVDVMTEYRIQKALDRLMKGRTSFVIAQRITTVLNADQIIVLDKGRVVAIGKHEDLMEDSPIYAEIYNSQLVGDVEVDEPELAGK